MNQESRIQTGADTIAVILLLTYLCIVIARWFQPATFTFSIEVFVLVMALAVLVLRQATTTHDF